jgi:hypothetical protein
MQVSVTYQSLIFDHDCSKFGLFATIRRIERLPDVSVSYYIVQITQRLFHCDAFVLQQSELSFNEMSLRDANTQATTPTATAAVVATLTLQTSIHYFHQTFFRLVNSSKMGGVGHVARTGNIINVLVGKR